MTSNFLLQIQNVLKHFLSQKFYTLKFYFNKMGSPQNQTQQQFLFKIKSTLLFWLEKPLVFVWFLLFWPGIFFARKVDTQMMASDLLCLFFCWPFQEEWRLRRKFFEAVVVFLSHCRWCEVFPDFEKLKKAKNLWLQPN